MRELAAQYLEKFTALCRRIVETQAERFDQAWTLLAADIGKGSLVYAWGDRRPR